MTAATLHFQQLLANFGLSVPGTLSRVGWNLPKSMPREQWIAAGHCLVRIEGAVQWWLGDWWAFGVDRAYGDGEEIAELIGVNYGTIRTYASVARAYGLSIRIDKLSFRHHQIAIAAPPDERQTWLAKAIKEDLSAETLRRAIRHASRGIIAGQKFELALFKKSASVIYADPPWKYTNSGFEGAAEDHYPPMGTDEICALKVAEICAKDAALFLWVTNPLLPDGLKVMEAWGFDYKTNFVWAKDKPMNSLGFYNRGQHEILLLGTRGSFVPEGAVRALPSSVFHAPKAEHSRKPVEAYELIEGLYPRYVPVMRELFCRGKGRDGWLPPFGNQSLDEFSEAAE